MKKLFYILPLLAAVSTRVQAQFGNSAWQIKPELHKVNPAFKNAPAIILLDEREVEYKTVDGNVISEVSYHQIVKVQSDSAISQFSSIIISQPEDDNTEIGNIKARSVMSGGKVFNLEDRNIIDLTKDGKTYKALKVEFLDSGAEIEYMYEVRGRVKLFGSKAFQNSSIPCQRAVFTLITPEDLKFSVVGYNGFTVGADTVVNRKRYISGLAENLVPFPEESFAFQLKYLARVDYKMSYSSNSPARLYTWNAFARKAAPLYKNLNPKEEKAIQQLLSGINIPITGPPEAQIAAVEDYVKTNIHINTSLQPGDSSDIAAIIQTHSADKQGAARLMAGMYTLLKQPFQLVYTAKRNNIPLDDKLEYWDRASEVMFYFPLTGKYVAAMERDYRYPFIHPLLAGSNALILADTVTAAGKMIFTSFRNIPVESYKSSYYNLDAELTFNRFLDSVIIKAKQTLGGYAAADYRPVYEYQSKERQAEMTRDLLRLPGNNRVVHVQVKNYEFSDGFRKPLTLTAQIDSREMINNWGRKVVVDIGKVIGEQTVLPQPGERRLPVEMDFPHTLKREIIIRLPRNYVVTNEEELKMNTTYTTPSGDTMSFVSSYDIKGYTIFLTVTETYTACNYPLSEFPHFQEVMNAAAVFYKRILILERK